VAMKSATKLVANTAKSHLRQRPIRDMQQIGVARGLPKIEKQIDSGRVRKFWRLSKPTIPRVKIADDRSGHCLHNRRIECATCVCKSFRLAHRVFERQRGTVDFASLRAKRLRHGDEDALEPRPAHRVFRREISAAEKWLAIRCKKRGQRPTALAGNRADR